MKIRLLFFILSVLFVSGADAQRGNRHRYYKKYFKNVATAYSDYLNKKTAQYWLPDSAGRVYSPKSEINPVYYRLFAPLAIYKSTVSKAMNDSLDDDFVFDDSRVKRTEILPVHLYREERDEAIINATDCALANVYLSSPTMVKGTEEQIMGQRLFKENVMPNQPRKQNVVDLINHKDWNDPDVNQNLVVRKPNFWMKSASISLQFTQNYISKNWYKGGESNNSMLSGLDMSLNYNDQQRIQFDNRLEWKLGFVSSRSDSIHKYKTNTDQFRLTSKLGINAFYSWFYTIQFEFSTQLMGSYKTNSRDVVSGFMAPGYVEVDFGMDFKKNLKNFTFSSVISPFSYKLTYVGDEDVDVTKFGVEEGKKSKNDIGSNLQINSKWTIVSNVVWESRLSYYTTYKRAETEWENTFNFQLNRYLSTKLFVHARFDDGVEKDEDDDSYMQLSELLSFGLSYSF